MTGTSSDADTDGGDTTTEGSGTTVAISGQSGEVTEAPTETPSTEITTTLDDTEQTTQESTGADGTDKDYDQTTPTNIAEVASDDIQYDDPEGDGGFAFKRYAAGIEQPPLVGELARHSMGS